MAVEVYETVLGLNIAGNYAALVQHWRTDVTGGETPFEVAKDLVDVALESTVGGDQFLNALAGLMAEDCFISSARARRITQTGGASYVKPYGVADWVGWYTGNTDGAQVAGFMIGFTDGGGGIFAKNWIPGVAEGALVAGRWTSTYKTAAQDYLTQWVAGLDGATYHYDPVLKHGSPSPTFNQIVSGQLGLTPGTIRRRLVPV